MALHNHVMILELRTYRLKPGSADEFVRVMTSQSMPLLARHGITVLDCGLSLDSDGEPQADAYLIRAFESLAARDEQENAFYGSDAWLNGPREAIVSRIESYHTIVLDLPAAAVRAFAAGSSRRA